MGLREKLAELREEGLQDIKQSEDLKRINEIRVKMLGRRDRLLQFFGACVILVLKNVLK